MDSKINCHFVKNTCPANGGRNCLFVCDKQTSLPETRSQAYPRKQLLWILSFLYNFPTFQHSPAFGGTSLRSASFQHSNIPPFPRIWRGFASLRIIPPHLAGLRFAPHPSNIPTFPRIWRDFASLRILPTFLHSTIPASPGRDILIKIVFNLYYL